MSERTVTYSRIHPWTRTAATDVVAWVARVTIAEGNASIFDDVTWDVPPEQVKLFSHWTRREIDAFLASTKPRRGKNMPDPIERLHLGLDARLRVVERQDLDAEGLPE